MIRSFLIHLLGGFTAKDVRIKEADASNGKAYEVRRDCQRDAAKRSAQWLLDLLTMMSEINRSTPVEWVEEETYMQTPVCAGDPSEGPSTKGGTLGQFLVSPQGLHYDRSGTELWVKSALKPLEVTIGEKVFVLSGTPDGLKLEPKA